MLQAAAAFSRKGASAIYLSGEEAGAQLRMRGQRLGRGGGTLIGKRPHADASAVSRIASTMLG